MPVLNAFTETNPQTSKFYAYLKVLEYFCVVSMDVTALLLDCFLWSLFPISQFQAPIMFRHFLTVCSRQSSAIDILSRIEDRLVRVEAVLNTNRSESALSPGSQQPAYNAGSPTSSRSKLSTEDWRKYFQHIISVPYYDTSVKQTAGEAVVARPSLISFQCPYYIDYDTWDDTSVFYDDEFEGEETLNAAIDYINRRPGFPQLSSTTAWQLQKSFVLNFLNWYPLMEPNAFVQHVERAKIDGFGERSESNCLVLLGFAVGAISSSDTSLITSRIEQPYAQYPGLAYYAYARNMLNYLARGSRRNIILLQCRLLIV
jgi:hypothetical protein